MTNREQLDQLVDPPLVDSPVAAPRPRHSARRQRLERLAMGVMALGFAMMFQPFAKILFTYSFIVILVGTLFFIIVSHLPE